jgi:hypothetical protein
VEVRPRNATGTGSAGALVTWAWGAGWLIAKAPYPFRLEAIPIIPRKRPCREWLTGQLLDSLTPVLAGH